MTPSPAAPDRTVLFWPAVDPIRLQAFQQAATSLLLVNCESELEATQQISEAEGFVGQITPTLLAGATRLRWIQAVTASLEHTMFPELIDHPCQMSNCRGLFGDVIAEHVFALLLSMSRQLHHYRDRQRSRRFEPHLGGFAGKHEIDFAAGPHEVSAADRSHFRLQDWSMLIVGVGGIGIAVATRAAAWGMSVAGIDPIRRSVPGVLPTIDVPKRLPELIGHHDVVVIAAPQTPETEGLFDADLIARMRRGSRLINVGRGAIVDLEAVSDALDRGHLAAAGLDVFATEPLPEDHSLWRQPNAILTPHVAACSPIIAERHLRLLCDNLARFAEGRPLRNLIDKVRWF